MRQFAVVMPLSLLLGACAATSGSGRAQFVAPQPIGAVYSEVNLQRSLMLADLRACRPDTCGAVAAFDRQLRRIGERLAPAARGEAQDRPELRFDVRLLDTVEQGTASSAAGGIVIHGGVREIGFAEPALAFLVAREMGHVLDRHHEEDSATNLVFSVLGSLLLPVGNLLRGAAAALTATDGVAAATTAVSMAGATAFKASYRAEQLREADFLALRLTSQAGWRVEEIADALTAAAPRLKDEGWSGDLLASKQRLEGIVAGPPWPLPAEEAEEKAARAAAAPVLAAAQSAAAITPSTTLTRAP